MTPEEKALLNKCVNLAEDNNNILHSIRRSMRLASLMRVLYWIVIIGSAYGAYYFIQPYLVQLVDIYGNSGDVLKILGR
jgi:hypothetical protein